MLKQPNDVQINTHCRGLGAIMFRMEMTYGLTEMEWVKSLRDIVFVWGTLSAVSVAALSYYQECEGCLSLYAVEIGLGLLSIVTSAILYVVLNRRVKAVSGGLNTIQVRQVKDSVDRFFREHKDDVFLSEDDMQFVYNLDEERVELGINSYTQRKLEYLKSKQVK